MKYRLVGGLALLGILAIGLGVEHAWLAGNSKHAFGADSAPASRGPIKLSETGQWQGVPEFLANATILKNDKPDSPQLQYVVENEGVLLLAVSWNYDGNRNDEIWPDECQTPAQLRQDGWSPIGRMSNMDGDRYYILRRKVHAGERLKIQTQLKAQGLLLSVPEDDVAKVMQADALVPEERKTLLEVRTAANSSAATTGSAAPGTLSLVMAEPEEMFGKYTRLGILLREIVLQGVALAGREELGLATRDNTLRELESGSGDANKPPLEVVTICQPLNELQMGVFQQRGGHWEAVYDDLLRFPADDLYERTVTAVEERSRNEFVAALKKAGYEQHTQPKSRDTAEVPAEAVELAQKLNVPAQFAVVRLLHAEISEHGESPELLDALARSYAMLGVLTDHLWSPAVKVFQARALLYAERAVHQWPKLALPIYSRAYVRALVGLHRTALEDCEAATKMSTELGSEAPAWSPIIEAFCKFDAPALEAAGKDSSQRNFVRLLQLMSAEFNGSTNSIVACSRALLEADHESLRAIDGMANIGEIGTHRFSAGAGPAMAASTLFNQLKAIPNLPEQAAKLIDDYQSAHGGVLNQLFGAKNDKEIPTRLKVIDALREAGVTDKDTSEPSWMQLATLLEEIDFLHTWRVVDVSVVQLGIPADEIIVATMPQVQKHPYGKFVESYRSDPPGAQQAMKELYSSVDVGLFCHGEEPMLYRMNKANPEWAKEHFPNGMHFNDLVASDLVAMIPHALEPDRSTKRLRDASPYMPFGIVMGLSYNIDGLREKKAELEEKYATSAPVLTMLGQLYEKDQQLDDAIRCLDASVKLDPSMPVYTGLADIYLKKGDEDQWLATLEEFLKTQQYGLGPAQVEVKIADHFIDKGDWKRARPYADEAAQSWSAWGLLKAGQCAEGMQDWQAAEDWYKAASKRYENIVWVWYEFCRRTGKGDAQESLQLTSQLLQRMEQYGSNDDRFSAGVVRSLAKQAASAATIFEDLYERAPTPLNGLYAVLTADEAGDTKSRDRLLTVMHDHGPQDLGGPKTTFAELAKLMYSSNSTGAALGKADLKKLEEIVTGDSATDRADLLFVIGWYLDRTGQKDDAIGFWKRCLQEHDTNPCLCARTLASASLLDRGVTIDAEHPVENDAKGN